MTEKPGFFVGTGTRFGLYSIATVPWSATCAARYPLHDRAGRVVSTIAGVLRDASSAGAIIGPYEDLKPAGDYLNKYLTESLTIEEPNHRERRRDGASIDQPISTIRIM